MAAAKAEHHHTSCSAGKGMKSDDRGEQNGNGAMFHSLSIPWLRSSFARNWSTDLVLILYIG